MSKKDEDVPYEINASQFYETFKNREIVTTTLGMDVSLGGGIPKGATVLIGGVQKTGKTSYALYIAAKCQKQYKSKIFFYNLEGRLTPLVLDQISSLDRTKDFTIISPPQIKDKDGNIIGSKKWSSEKCFEHIGKTIEENPGSVIIVDSISNLTSEKEISEDLSYSDMGQKNKIEAAFCRKYLEKVVPNKSIVIFICQLISVPMQYGYPFKMKVGSAMKFAADIILFGRTFKRWDPENGIVKGHTVNFFTEASALGPPFLECELSLKYGVGPCEIKDIITHSLNWMLIQKSGAWFSLPYLKDDKTFKLIDLNSLSKEIEPLKVQGESQLYDWLKEHEVQCKELDTIIRKKVFG